MSYELRTNTIQPIRQTFDRVRDLFGDKAASRYLEASIGTQPTENFHYRPLWAPEREIYDENYTAVKLTDPDAGYQDPRGYYYATYVAARAADYETFGRTLKYAEDRNLLAGLPENWLNLIKQSYMPLRHYEAGANLVATNATRFGWGTTLVQAYIFSAFDRIGNAQMHTMIGLAAGGGSSAVVDEVKQNWLEAEHLQPLRKYTEEAICEEDHVSGLIALDLIDGQLFPLLHVYTDEHALTSGAGVVSLLGQHFTSWYADQKKWLDALIKAWANDEQHGEANKQALGGFIDKWRPQANAALAPIAKSIDDAIGEGASEALAGYQKDIVDRYQGFGIPVTA